MDEGGRTGGDGATRAQVRLARLLDLRTHIAALFLIFGTVVTVLGLFPDDAALAKAEGININLYAGLGMLALGIFFLVWLLRAPPEVPQGHVASEDDMPEQLREHRDGSPTVEG